MVSQARRMHRPGRKSITGIERNCIVRKMTLKTDRLGGNREMQVLLRDGLAIEYV
jgi:hypothetical protein